MRIADVRSCQEARNRYDTCLDNARLNDEEIGGSTVTATDRTCAEFYLGNHLLIVAPLIAEYPS